MSDLLPFARPEMPELEPGLPTPVIITAYSDRTFTFVTKSTPATVLLKKAAGLTSGSKRPNTEKVGKVTRKQLEDIVKAKEADLTAASLEAGVRTIAGSARSMGLVVAFDILEHVQEDDEMAAEIRASLEHIPRLPHYALFPSRIPLLPRNLVLGFLAGYRKVISPLYGDVCAYYPSCSAYAVGAVQQHGAVKGAVLSAWRILRCNPWTQGGVDDVHLAGRDILAPERGRPVVG